MTGVCGLDMNGVLLVVIDVLGMSRVMKSASVGVLLLLRVRAAAVVRVCLWHRTYLLERSTSPKFINLGDENFDGFQSPHNRNAALIVELAKTNKQDIFSFYLGRRAYPSPAVSATRHLLTQRPSPARANIFLHTHSSRRRNVFHGHGYVVRAPRRESLQ